MLVVLLERICGQGNDWKPVSLIFSLPLPDLLGRQIPVHHGHVDIHQDQVSWLGQLALCDGINRLLSVMGLRDGEPKTQQK